MAPRQPKQIVSTQTFEIPANDLLDALGIEHDLKLLTHIDVSPHGDRMVTITLSRYHT